MATKRLARGLTFALPAGSGVQYGDLGAPDWSGYNQIRLTASLTGTGSGDAADTLDIYLQSRGANGVWYDRAHLGQTSASATFTGNMSVSVGAPEIRAITIQNGDATLSGVEPSGSAGASRLPVGATLSGIFPGPYFGEGSRGAAWRIAYSVVDGDNDSAFTGTIDIEGYSGDAAAGGSANVSIGALPPVTGSVTIVDGGDVVQGAVGDAAVAAGAAGTHSAKLRTISGGVGASSDAAASGDTGTFSLVAAVKRLLARFTTLFGLLPSSLGAQGGFKIEGVPSGTAVPVSMPAGGGNPTQTPGNPHSTGSGNLLIAVRESTPTDLSGGSDGNYTPLQVDATGQVWVRDAGVGVPADSAAGTDTATSGLVGLTKRALQRLTVLIGLLPASLGQAAKAASLAVTVASDDDLQGKLGALTETAPATDTASSGLNGRLQRVAQRLTALMALIPSALTGSGHFKVSIEEVTNNVTLTSSIPDSAASATVSVGTSSGPLVGARPKRKCCTIYNLDATNPVFISTGTATATSFKIPAGRSFTFACSAAINAIATGAAVDVSVWDEYIA